MKSQLDTNSVIKTHPLSLLLATIFKLRPSDGAGQQTLGEEKYRSESCNCSSLLSRESFPTTSQGGRTQAEPGCVPELNREIWESKEAKKLRFTGDSTEKERAQRKRTLDTCRGFVSSLQLNASQETIQCQEKNDLKRLKD